MRGAVRGAARAAVAAGAAAAVRIRTASAQLAAGWSALDGQWCRGAQGTGDLHYCNYNNNEQGGGFQGGFDVCAAACASDPGCGAASYYDGTGAGAADYCSGGTSCASGACCASCPGTLPAEGTAGAGMKCAVPPLPTRAPTDAPTTTPAGAVDAAVAVASLSGPPAAIAAALTDAVSCPQPPAGVPADPSAAQSTSASCARIPAAAGRFNGLYEWGSALVGSDDCFIGTVLVKVAMAAVFVALHAALAAAVGERRSRRRSLPARIGRPHAPGFAATGLVPVHRGRVGRWLHGDQEWWVERHGLLFDDFSPRWRTSLTPLVVVMAVALCAVHLDDGGGPARRGRVLWAAAVAAVARAHAQVFLASWGKPPIVDGAIVYPNLLFNFYVWARSKFCAGREAHGEHHGEHEPAAPAAAPVPDKAAPPPRPADVTTQPTAPVAPAVPPPHAPLGIELLREQLLKSGYDCAAPLSAPPASRGGPATPAPPSARARHQFQGQRAHVDLLRPGSPLFPPPGRYGAPHEAERGWAGAAGTAVRVVWGKDDLPLGIEEDSGTNEDGEPELPLNAPLDIQTDGGQTDGDQTEGDD
eukprot:gene19120-40798_t